MVSDSLLILDACSAINLLGSGSAEEVLRALPHDVAVARLVMEREVLHVGPEADLDPVGVEEPSASESTVEISLRPLVDDGLLRVLDLNSDDEHQTYVALALQLDDGEAMTGAIAIHRGALLATDDKKAIRILGKQLPEHSIVRTSELLKDWADHGVPASEVRRALRNIERRASFRPPSNDPLREWWDRVAADR